jgi:hypothetical protein
MLLRGSDLLSSSDTSLKIRRTRRPVTAAVAVFCSGSGNFDFAFSVRDFRGKKKKRDSPRPSAHFFAAPCSGTAHNQINKLDRIYSGFKTFTQ